MENFVKEVSKRKDEEQNLRIKNAYEARIIKTTNNIDKLKELN